MHIEYQLTLQDHLEAQRAHRGSTLLVMVNGSVCCGLGVAVWLHDPNNLPGAIVLSLAGLCSLFYLPVCTRYKFQQNLKSNEAVSVDILETGLHLSGAHVSSQLDWPIFEQQLESKNFFLLYFHRKLFLPVPKRSFEADDLNEFRRLLDINSISPKKPINRALIWVIVVAEILALVQFFSMALKLK